MPPGCTLVRSASSFALASYRFEGVKKKAASSALVYAEVTEPRVARRLRCETTFEFMIAYGARLTSGCGREGCSKVGAPHGGAPTLE